MIFLDTGYLLALFDPADELHARATAFEQAGFVALLRHLPAGVAGR